jgi:EAL domain-containing protein (putative c-di-GMP-specific phosphodiesterase class I)
MPARSSPVQALQHDPGGWDGAALVRAAAALVRLEASERRRTIRDLRRAAAEGGFSLSLAPCHCLHRPIAGDGVRGAEASLRWPRRLGMASAGGLLPLIASSGLTAEVGTWLVQAACESALGWTQSRAAETIVSFDVPAECLADASLLAMVSEALEATGLAAERLEIEIAEPALAEGGGDAVLVLSALCDLGVGIALDNFGSASACLMTLKNLPLTTVKLDRSLVRDLPRDRVVQAMVAAIIDCAHALEAKTVAIGVETERQRDLLAGLGCDYAQGPLYGAPLTAEGFAAALA